MARQAREAAMDAGSRAYFDAQASDPARRKRQEAKNLRTRYSLGFVDSDIYPRVMGLMRQVDTIAGLADVTAYLDARRADF